jgi:hypothetical protein
MHKASTLFRNIKLDNTVQMRIITVSEAEVKTIIMSLRPKNSTGYDRIPNKILKHCVRSISKPLTYIYNCSLTTGIFQESCKFATVRPSIKQEEKKEINNCRPTDISANSHV